METVSRARHRLGGRHSDPIIVPGNQQKKPSGRRSAVLNPLPETTALVIPPMPDRAPRVVIREVDDDDNDRDVPAITVASTPITVAWHKTALTSLAAIAAGGLLLISGGSGSTAAPVATKTDKTGKHSAASDLELEDAEPHPITAQVTAILNQEEVDVTTVAAPKPVAPAPVVAAAPRHLAQTPAAVVPPKPAIATTTPAAPAPPPVVASSGKGMAIAQGAIRQIGMMQDCTALASNSLGAAGMNVPRRWPWEYASLGTNVGLANAQPGDLLLYAAQNGMPAHIGVYIGNGRAVHGGWNGNQTVEWSTTVGQPGFGPYAAIRVA